MTENIRQIAAPTIRLTGTRVLDNGTTSSVVNMIAAQAYGTTAHNMGSSLMSAEYSVYEPPIYTFANYVSIVMTAPDGLSMEDYSMAPGVLDPFDQGHTTGMLQTGEHMNQKGNILYFLGPKMPSPTEAEIYTKSFVLASPTIDPDLAASLASLYHIKGYYSAGDITTITAAVFIEGKISQEATVRIKVG